MFRHHPPIFTYPQSILNYAIQLGKQLCLFVVIWSKNLSEMEIADGAGGVASYFVKLHSWESYIERENNV